MSGTVLSAGCKMNEMDQVPVCREFTLEERETTNKYNGISSESVMKNKKSGKGEEAMREVCYFVSGGWEKPHR